jgi:hypothetical protein
MFNVHDCPDGSVLITMSNAQGRVGMVRLTAGEMPSFEIEAATFKVSIGPNNTVLPPPPLLKTA